MDCYWIKDSIKNQKVEEIYDIGHEIYRCPFQVEGALSVVSACYNLKTRKAFGVNIMKKKVGYCPDNSDVGIFLKLKDINVMRIVEIFETFTHINVVREHLVGDQLFNHFKKYGPYTENKVGKITKQILSGVRYLHEHDIIHGNIKSENLLVVDVGENLILKICDHIQSRIVHYDIYRLSIIALPSLCPPEVLLSQIRTFALDMWSIGICIFILLCGYEPFYREKITELFRAVITSDYSYNNNCESTSNASKDFLNRLLMADPKSRMNIVSAIKHPWTEICAIKNQPLEVIYPEFIKCITDIEDRMTTKVMDDIRRANDIFAKLILRTPYKTYY